MSDAEKIRAAIDALEAQRALLGDAAVNAAITTLQAQLETLQPAPLVSLDLTGERKLVTVMFADISGFTSLSETMDPEEVRALMNACFDMLVPVVQEFEGTIDKFIGDEIMALFGAPLAHERHAELACAAALQLMKTLELFNATYHTSLDLHIGINSGMVIAGGIGSKGRQDYSVMGDAVNLAARLKDAATRGEIFVGEDVESLARDYFYFQSLPPMRMKGKQEMVRSWKLLHPRERRSIPREKAFQSVLVGRETELAQIAEALSRLDLGLGARIFLIGEAGIGKSRLLVEVSQISKQQLEWVEGISLPNRRQSAYHAAAEILTKLLFSGGLYDSSLLRQRLDSFFGTATDGQGLLDKAALAHMLQLPLVEEEEITIRYLKGTELRSRISSAFFRFLKVVAVNRPVVMVWDDLHWADPSSLALLEDVMAVSDEAPVVFILVFRPQKEEKIWELQERSFQDATPGFLRLFLEPLPVAESAALARKLLHVEQLAPDVEEVLLEKAEGNPFFMEELLRALLDHGILYIEGKKIKSTGKLQEMTIPRTLQGVIASRIDRLLESDKQVLQIASVLGRIFRNIILARLLTSVRSHASLDPTLQRLVVRELLQLEQDTYLEEGAYFFKHAITHDVVYHSLLQSDRKILHKIAGEVLEELFGLDKNLHAERIAFHYELATEAEKALHFLTLAAEQAQSRHFNEEALALLKRAIIQAEYLLSRPGDHPRWHAICASLKENKADILRISAQVTPAIAAYNAAKTHLLPGDDVSQARLLRKVGMCHHGLSRIAEMKSYLLQAQELLETKPPAERTPDCWTEWIEVLNERMMLHYWTNETAEMQAIADLIFPHLKEHAQAVQQARFFGNMAALHIRLEAYLLGPAAAQFAEQAVQAAVHSGNLQQESSMCFNLAFSKLWKNDMRASIPDFEKSLELAEKTGDLVIQSRNLAYLAVAYRRLGAVEQTKYWVAKTLELAPKAGMTEYVGSAHANLSWIAFREEAWQDVWSHGEKAFQTWRSLSITHSSLVFAWLAVFPLFVALTRKLQFAACCPYLEELLQPGRKKLEPELVESIQAFLNGVSADGTDPHPLADEVIRIGTAYQYL